MEAFVERLRAGEDEAFEELVRRFGGRMLAAARRMLRDEEDAKDAVQDAFLRAFRGLPDFEARAAIGSWLHRILITSCLMKLRSRRRKPPPASIDDFLPSFHADGHRVIPANAWRDPAAFSAERAETRQIVLEAIDELPDDHRTVILLRDVEDLDTRETAELLDISPPAVKTRLHRARLALRRLLENRYRAGAL